MSIGMNSGLAATTSVNLLYTTRPEDVRKAIQSKFNALQNNPSRRQWVNMGESVFPMTNSRRNRIIVNREGKFIFLDKIFENLITQRRQNRQNQQHQQSRQSEQQPQFKSEDSTKDYDRFQLLDLGTGSGELLRSLNQRFGVPMDGMIGISALDYRRSEASVATEATVTATPSAVGQTMSPLPSPSVAPGASAIPDASYVVANIDNLLEELHNGSRNKTRDKCSSKLDAKNMIGGSCTSLLPALSKATDIMFDVIWSRHTLYHTVDPIAVVEMVLTILKPKGVALLFHVPVKAQRISPVALLNCIIKMKNIDIACVEEMPESPGNFMVFAQAKNEKDFSNTSTKGYPSFASFIDYEDKCVTAAGTYTYATLYSRDSNGYRSLHEDRNGHTQEKKLLHATLSAEQFLTHACKLHSKQFEDCEPDVVQSSNDVVRRGLNMNCCRCM
mmetsp:Transcript_1313/g.1979  ORF Transcript_1313/g.1979 Transcript_1313/m.1979 type:complete len:444 (-) Transcript_1313:109-1440(-)